MLENTLIFSLTANKELTEEVASILGLPVSPASVNHFADGEIICEPGLSVRDKKVFVIQSTCGPVTEHLFEILNESGVLLDNDKLKIMEAFIEVRSFREFEELVTKHGENWNDDIYIYHNYDWEDYGREMFNNCGYELPGDLENYFDFEEYGKSFSYSDNIEEFSGGLIEIN